MKIFSSVSRFPCCCPCFLPNTGSVSLRSLSSQVWRSACSQLTSEITPVCEEVMKLLPLLFYFLIFEPEKKQVTSAALALSVGFATFENACYLTENGASQFSFLLIRGISAGAVHILCGILIGCGMAYVFYHRWLRLTGTIGLVGACIILHASYNLLITADGIWRRIGYVFPSLLILLLFLARHLLIPGILPSEARQTASSGKR